MLSLQIKFLVTLFYLFNIPKNSSKGRNQNAWLSCFSVIKTNFESLLFVPHELRRGWVAGLHGKGWNKNRGMILHICWCWTWSLQSDEKNCPHLTHFLIRSNLHNFFFFFEFFIKVSFNFVAFFYPVLPLFQLILKNGFDISWETLNNFFHMRSNRFVLKC